MSSDIATAQNLLFTEFATLVAAPGGFIKLRELILQLAVQGKLVPQNPEDEPAHVLLERIKAEKARLVKEGKIKKSKALPPVTEDEVPFEVPKGWVWTRLEELGLINPRNIGFPDDLESSFIPMPLISEKYGVSVCFENKKWGEIRKGYTHFTENDVVLAKITPCFQNGKCAVVKGLINGIGAGTTELHVFRSMNGLVTPYYVLLYLKSPNFLNEGILKMTGSAGQKRVPKEYFSRNPFPLPPLAEQHRIVEKVDALMKLCDELEAQQMKQREMQAKLGVAALASLTEAEDAAAFADAWARICDEFDLIFDTVENVTALRQAILQLAVQGKLVPQNPTDEPARVLLERIKAEKARLVKEGKIKKSKGLPPVREDEEPFEVPEGWVWVQLGNIVLNRDSERIPLSRTERETRKGPYEYYGASGVIDHIDDYLFDKPLLLIGEDGANLLNRSTPIAFIAKGKYWVNNHAHVLDSISTEFLNYISLFINAIDLRPYVTGTAQPKMNQAKMNSIPIAIPPTNEQMKIITKVDAIMALCDELEQRIQKRQETQTKLLESVVAQITA